MIQIRDFEPGDEIRMREIAPRAFGVYARFGIDRTLPRDKVEECYRREMDGYANRMVKEDPNLWIFIAEAENKAVGFIVVGINSGLSELYGFKWGSIISLAVDPDWHGKGIGSQLIAKGLEWLKNNGIKYAEVATDQNNIAAIRAYEKNGFRVIYCGIHLSQWL